MNSNDEWLPASTHQPEMWQKVICYCRPAKLPVFSHAFICVGVWSGVSGYGGPEYRRMHDEDGESRVTHWMPLPDPPG
jgi:hypothetical protein